MEIGDKVRVQDRFDTYSSYGIGIIIGEQERLLDIGNPYYLIKFNNNEELLLLADEVNVVNPYKPEKNAIINNLKLARKEISF